MAGSLATSSSNQARTWTMSGSASCASVQTRWKPWGERLDRSNHVEAGVMTPMRYIGIDTVDRVAIEYDEFDDGRLQASIAAAEAEVDALVARLSSEVG
ncbi:MAG TPA: hypothetical protein VIT90_18195 [Lysobacter sp.]